MSPSRYLANRPTIANGVLWTVQGLLALLFLSAGAMKLALPAAALAGPFHLPVAFLRFIGVCEMLGAAGLVLPSLLRVRPILTPLAACGLVIIMTGATTLTFVAGMVGPALAPLCVGLLAATVAYGRWRIAPIRPSSRISAPSAPRRAEPRAA